MLLQPEHAELSVRRQCSLLGLNRRTLYYEPVAVSAEEIALMKEIDRIFTKRPFYGSRKIVVELARAGFADAVCRSQRVWQRPDKDQIAGAIHLETGIGVPVAPSKYHLV